VAVYVVRQVVDYYSQQTRSVGVVRAVSAMVRLCICLHDEITSDWMQCQSMLSFSCFSDQEMIYVAEKQHWLHNLLSTPEDLFFSSVIPLSCVVTLRTWCTYFTLFLCDNFVSSLIVLMFVFIY